jgi:hypothetical protein
MRGLLALIARGDYTKPDVTFFTHRPPTSNGL